VPELTWADIRRLHRLDGRRQFEARWCLPSRSPVSCFRNGLVVGPGDRAHRGPVCPLIRAARLPIVLGLRGL